MPSSRWRSASSLQNGVCRGASYGSAVLSSGPHPPPAVPRQNLRFCHGSPGSAGTGKPFGLATWGHLPLWGRWPSEARSDEVRMAGPETPMASRSIVEYELTNRGLPSCRYTGCAPARATRGSALQLHTVESLRILSRPLRSLKPPGFSARGELRNFARFVHGFSDRQVFIFLLNRQRFLPKNDETWGGLRASPNLSGVCHTDLKQDSYMYREDGLPRRP